MPRPAAPLSITARLGHWIIRYLGFPFLADHLKHGKGRTMARLSRWGVFDEPLVRCHLMMLAITHAEVPLVEALMARGIGPDHMYGGSSLLHWSMASYSCVHEPDRRMRSLAIVQMFLEHGADLQCQNRHGRSAWQEIEQRPQEIGQLIRLEQARRERVDLDMATIPSVALAAGSSRRL